MTEQEIITVIATHNFRNTWNTHQNFLDLGVFHAYDLCAVLSCHPHSPERVGWGHVYARYGNAASDYAALTIRRNANREWVIPQAPTGTHTEALLAAAGRMIAWLLPTTEHEDTMTDELYHIERVHTEGRRSRLTTEPVSFRSAHGWAETYTATHPGAPVEVVRFNAPSIYMVEQDTPLGWVPVGPKGLGEVGAYLARRSLEEEEDGPDFRVVSVEYHDEKTDEALRIRPHRAAGRIVSWCRDQQDTISIVEAMTFRYLEQTATEFLTDAENLRQKAEITSEEAVILTAEGYIRDEMTKIIWRTSTEDHLSNPADKVARDQAKGIILAYLMDNARYWSVAV